MKIKKLALKCTECDLEFVLTHSNKDTVSYCPFCGDDIIEKKDSPPLLKDFESMDEFDDDDLYNDDDDYLDDEDDE